LKIELNLDTVIAQLSEDLNDLDQIIRYNTEARDALDIQLKEDTQKLARKIGALHEFQAMRKREKENRGISEEEMELVNDEFPPDFFDTIHDKDLPPGVADSIKAGMKDLGKDVMVKTHGKKEN
jgi:hypothetical protein